MSAGDRYIGPFRARWLDGRVETIDRDVLLEDEVEAFWQPQRNRGAVVLLDSTNVVRDSNYTEGALTTAGLGPRARVRHKRHPKLVGTVQGFEYQTTEPFERSRLSAMPLRVYWDESWLAADLLGWFHIYPAAESLEPVL